MEKNLKGFKETQKIPEPWFNPPKIPSRDTRKLSLILSLFWMPKKVPAEINLPKKILAEILLSNAKFTGYACGRKANPKKKMRIKK